MPRLESDWLQPSWADMQDALCLGPKCCTCCRWLPCLLHELQSWEICWALHNPWHVQQLQG